MRVIDQAQWPRRKHFEMFRHFDYPHFNICVDVDLSVFFPAIKKWGYPVSASLMYVMIRAALPISEFRYRIRGDEVVEHEIIHPSVTVLAEDDLFSFFTVKYENNFQTFLSEYYRLMEREKKNPSLEEEPLKDDLIYMTALPWFSFTGLMHPLHLNPVDSIPRIAWGKISTKEKSVRMPLCVQAHHALMDGVHLGKFLELLQEMLDNPEKSLSAV